MYVRPSLECWIVFCFLCRNLTTSYVYTPIGIVHTGVSYWFYCEFAPKEMSSRRLRFSTAPATVSRPPDEPPPPTDILAMATREIAEEDGTSGPGEGLLYPKPMADRHASVSQWADGSSGGGLSYPKPNPGTGQGPAKSTLTSDGPSQIGRASCRERV